ncbi:BrnT family toxin [Halochromatium salexigens]|uniref:BrnT family toxin n=1 Tax=Halochromatium salexigens TaxID=49447 RepID=A0AAJ0UDZ2_HALSE|nr:BrnT family toxin [Halochromatium salexigens]MBK5929679.1 hypothetical protein [Halochromatium salexigens]
MQLEYDPDKRVLNLRKHGVDLEDASIVLSDPRALIREDADALEKQRFIAVGSDALARLLTVVYTYGPPDIIRLISARRASAKEQRAYES